MTTLITDIAKNIQLPDTELNIIIQSYLDDNPTETQDVTQWRIENYSELRRWAYPLAFDLTDAMVKIENGNSEEQLEGHAQRIKYYDDCYDLKQRFPKL